VAVDDLARTLLDRVAAGRTVLLSSHQLDLVQDLCEQIVMIDHGRAVLEGSVAALRASSGGRQLRLGLAPQTPRDWLTGFPDVAVAEDQADALRLDLPAGVDPLAVLDAARAAGPVTDFGLDLPTLSQLFLTAVEADPPATPVGSP
jgi:ABC-2 type transport system ATP-binding protein